MASNENADYAKIKDDITTLKNDLASVLKLFEKEGLSHVKDAISSAKDSIKGSCDIHKMEDCIKKNPKESIAIALVAGAFLACFLGRK